MADQANMKYKTMYELYRRIDEDGDGKIDINEFDAGLKRCGFADALKKKKKTRRKKGIEIGHTKSRS